ncbi:ABC transporter [Enterococcus olivae]
MNKKQLLELTKINLLYANPQATTKARGSGKSGKKLTRSLINQYLLSGVLFLAIYGFTMMLTDFSRMPGFFTYYVALFGIIAFSQGISVIYNVFFESQDLAGYLPLPFKQVEIFLAKIVVVALTVIPFTIPVLIVFLLTGIRSGVFIGVVVLSGILQFVLFLALIFSICSFIVFGLTRTKFFKKHKKLVTSLLLVVTMGIAVIGILLMNNQTNSIDFEMMDRSAISIFMPFFYTSAAPFSTKGLLSLLGLLTVTVIMLFLIKLTLLPRLYDQLLDASPGISTEKRTYKKNQNLRQLLLNYNFQLIRDPNLIMQVFSNSVLLPVIFIISFAISGGYDLSFLTNRFVGLVFFAGVAFSLLSVNQMSFVANIISLDKENFLFIRSLPLSMERYLREKFRFACGIQLIINSLIALLTGLIFHLPLLHLVSMILGNIFSTYILSMRYFSRDYRLLQLNWTNIGQLFTRGAGNMGMVFTMMGGILVSGILLVAYGVGTMFISFWLLDLPIFLVFFIGLYSWSRHYQQNFWSRF